MGWIVRKPFNHDTGFSRSDITQMNDRR
jgi:hypothetical protein